MYVMVDDLLFIYYSDDLMFKIYFYKYLGLILDILVIKVY